MSRFSFVYCAATLAVGLAAPVSSQPIGVSSLGADTFGTECSRDEGVLKTFCAGYILGAADQLAIAGEICRPVASAGNVQTLAIVRTFLARNPALKSKHPAWLVKEALRGPFPCAKK